MKILTIVYGGVWKMKDGEGSYEGDMKSKAFVFDEALELQALKLQIISRFKINVEVCDLILSHLHPSQKLTSPYIVEDNEDLRSFFAINESTEVPWSLPLHVSSARSSCNVQSEQIVTVHQGDDTVQQLDNPIHQDLQSHDSNQQHLEDDTFDDSTEQGDDTVQRDKGINDTFDDANQRHLEDDTAGQGDDIFQRDRVIDDTFDDASAQFNPHGRSTVSDFLHVGEIFNTKDEVKDAIANLAIRENYGYRVNKSTKKLLKLKCVDKHCKWNFRAAKLEGTQIFEIRRFNNVHTCPLETRSAQRCQPSYRFIAEQIKRRYASGVEGGPNPKSIQIDFENDYSQNISYWKAWKAKEWAQSLIEGTPESNYRLLPSYLYILRQVNPSTYTSFETEKDGRFKYAFVSIGASIKGFAFMRKVIMVDSTNLHGKYKGVLIIVTTQDANNQIYPLAFAVVDSENDAAWTWFFEQLHNVMSSTNSLVIVSELHKSIATSIEKVYESSIHVVCTRHLKESLKDLFKEKGIHNLFSLASESYTKKEFHYYFNKISEMNPRMSEYLERVKFEKWARVYCPGERYNIMTTYSSESINSALKEARSYQLVALLEHIRDLLSRWFHKRKELATKNQNQLPPHVREVVEERRTESARYEVKILNNVHFEVFGGKFHGLVDLSRKACSCRVFDVDHIPCAHAIAAIQKTKGNISDYVSTYYHYSAWANSYQETIFPVPMRSQWDIPNDVASIACESPFVKRQSGRPRKRRLFPEEEFRERVIKKKRKSNKCGECGNLGHNKATCKYKASSSKTSNKE